MAYQRCVFVNSNNFEGLIRFLQIACEYFGITVNTSKDVELKAFSNALNESKDLLTSSESLSIGRQSDKSRTLLVSDTSRPSVSTHKLPSKPQITQQRHNKRKRN